MTNLVTDRWLNFGSDVRNYISNNVGNMIDIEVDESGYYCPDFKNFESYADAAGYCSYCRYDVYRPIASKIGKESESEHLKFIREDGEGSSAINDWIEYKMDFPVFSYIDDNGNNDVISITSEFVKGVAIDLYHEGYSSELYLESSSNNIMIVEDTLIPIEFNVDDILMSSDDETYEMFIRWVTDCVTEYLTVANEVKSRALNEYYPYMLDVDTIVREIPNYLNHENPVVTIDMDTLTLVDIDD